MHLSAVMPGPEEPGVEYPACPNGLGEACQGGLRIFWP
jgi:hypothetical protein